MVNVVEYDIQWPRLFADEKARILSALSTFDHLFATMEHIGSTAVPGLVAKPVIDILIGTRFAELTKGHLEALRGLGYGYIRARRNGLCLYRGHPRSHFVHIVEINCPEWCDLLLFRDFLRAHSEEANKYGELKTKLSGKSQRPTDYIQGKRALVLEILQKARRWNYS
ncbi:GrpB family protein [Desulfocastanea catecholica]